MFKPYNRAELEFEYQKEIGHEGKNSKVFVAYDPQLNTQLVIKQIAKKGFNNKNEYYDESRILHKSSHPNVVPINYACECDENIYLAMPFFENGSLNILLNARFLTVREIIRYATQFLGGIHNIHSKGLIHFDIKPDNILISTQDEAKLSDFGLAKESMADGQAQQNFFYAKMAPPEMLLGQQNLNNLVDIYQTGLTIYRMCVGNQEFYYQFGAYGGQADFDRESFVTDVVEGRFPNRESFPEHIPARMRSTIRKCLMPDPTDRYSSAIEVVNDLASIDGNDLDWAYDLAADGQRSWIKATDRKKTKLVIHPDSSSLATKIIDNGKEQRITTYCAKSLNIATIKRFLREN